jgi:hypothetical protein
MEITQDAASMLPPGDYATLDKYQREAFHALQERMVQLLMQECSHYQIQFPDLHIDFKFQADVYKSPLSSPSTVRYSNKRVY